MKKLAILFPGVNYSVDCPLLYYAGDICENAGFAIYKVKYEGYGKAQTAAKASSLEECIKLEYEALKGKLPRDMLQEYEELVFVSKSMGTVLAAHLEEDYSLPKVTHVMLTPIDQTLPYLKAQKKIAYMVTGTADNKVNHEVLREMSREHNYPLTEIEGAGHRLEIKGDVQKSIKILADIMEVIEKDRRLAV